jgi:hypothetical protein
VKATGVTNVRAPIALDALHYVWPIASADGIILHQYDPHLALGGDAGIDQRRCRDTLSGVAALSLRSVQTRRLRNRPKQPSLRPEPSRSQPKLGSVRPRSGCRDGANLRIFGSGYHRNARKQSEPASLIVSRYSDRPPNGRCRYSHRGRGSSLGVSWQPGSDDRMPEERSEKTNHNNAKDKTPRFENRGGVVVGGQPVGIAHAKLLGRPPASRPHQTLIKMDTSINSRFDAETGYGA